MPQVDKHQPGDFCWMELATSDQKAAKSFYSSMFGSTPNDMPMGPDSYYTIFEMNGRHVAAGYTMMADEAAHNVPPHWNLYIAVENVDASAAKAAELGGRVVAGPFDVMEAGRMAVILDPTGAIFQIWQANKNQGVGFTNEPGTFCWADLNTPDMERAKEFYSGLFGWKISAGEKDPDGYLHIQNGEKYIGGIPPAAHRDPNAPPHWLLYFDVADVDASAAKATGMGAKILAGPMDIEHVGRFAVIADPQGAVSAIFKSAPQPH